MSTVISMQDLLDNALHFGHKTSRWNPKIRPYIYGKKHDIHIFDLNKTVQKMKEAFDYLHKSVSEGKVVLFVATKPQAGPLVKEISKSTKMPYVTEKWLCGLLTNFETIKNRIKHFKNLKEMKKTGELEKYTKKEQSKFTKEMLKLGTMLGGVENMGKIPDILFIVDTFREKNAVAEAEKLHISTIGIVDTNADPTKINYPIPANDDALKSLTFIMKLVEEVVLDAQKKGSKKQEPETKS